MVLLYFLGFFLFYVKAIEESNQDIQMQTCFYITQFYIDENQQDVYKAIGQFTTQELQIEAYHQILMEQVILCMKQLNTEEQLKALQSIQSQKLEIDQYKHLYKKFKYSNWQMKKHGDLRKLEQKVLQFIKELQAKQTKNKNNESKQDQKVESDRSQRREKRKKQREEEQKENYEDEKRQKQQTRQQEREERRKERDQNKYIEDDDDVQKVYEKEREIEKKFQYLQQDEIKKKPLKKPAHYKLYNPEVNENKLNYTYKFDDIMQIVIGLGIIFIFFMSKI